MAFATVNPYTNELVKEFPSATEAEIVSAIDKADAAFQSWKNLPVAERVSILGKAAKHLRDNIDEHAKLITLEMGKVFAESKAEVELSAQILEYYVKHAEEQLQPRKLPVMDPAEGEASLVYEPLGVLLAIEPWNFPYYQVARILAPQLSAGNTLILKHASNVPQCAAAFEKMMLEVGLPEGVFINLFAEHHHVETILQDPRVCGVALTGSEFAGSAVAQVAGKHLKKSIMELGGADAFVVLDDADIEKTAKWGVFGRHWNGGQVCVSSKRMIVDAKVYDEYLEKYTAGVAALKAGDPMDPATQLAPLSSQRAKDGLLKQIEEAVKHGATAIEVGEKVPVQGCFVQPTILTNVTPDNPAYYQEFFGPVSMIFKAKDEADAIRIANDSPFGLGGSVFTSDNERGRKVALQISTGMVFVNHPTMVKADLPFGGVRRSGFGRELIDLGLKEFVNQKLVDIVDIDAPF
ncbi:NAD-dependent succinate-semialdehyde dehydrogenase [Wohlfahrtiimonas chitiniclastica]|uniref:NAD-dependent succinate-semialdehyde dehydrogenase n=1 Tax=Wohlfahrtiimonas chitiniclastica TaxID=400946 RepID=UPI0007B408D2|nr:NAD-dependent succinate-semialdehyde dehydrogenase [Wohlfahrtiimonas chitiniclastica]KZS22576.1 succinate-semialdehyde dehydrogenase [Wohlfahrtiimonas chitiniclastica]MBS7835565.1 NAD-dependent succinate-semialdehyde dehydrogenase [Wohlfahrtiimonas chitiniclastica]WHR55051.1 NAD-dependent succinate-semialdehyde dehydrogenase [Wohlfahrtiimonas chitiniclastica]